MQGVSTERMHTVLGIQSLQHNVSAEHMQGVSTEHLEDTVPGVHFPYERPDAPNIQGDPISNTTPEVHMDERQSVRDFLQALTNPGGKLESQSDGVSNYRPES